MLKRIAKELTGSGATYLGMKPMDLMTQLTAGKRLADVAAATPGKSRDRLIPALSAGANAKVDAAVTAATLTADQAAKAKSTLRREIAKRVDRSGHK